jgi:outer membrane receptor for ferrienterochelin and colicin
MNRHPFREKGMEMKGMERQARALRAGSALAILAIALVGAPAYAEDAPQDGSGEIFVVARKRAETKSVPVSVGVLSDSDLSRLAIKDVADYTRQTPARS